MKRKDVHIFAPPAHAAFSAPVPGGAPPDSGWFAGVNPVSAEINAALNYVPSPQEIIQAQDVEIRRLKTELYQVRVTASTIANAAVAVTHLLLEAQGNKSPEVYLPAELRYKLDGTQIKVRSEPDGSAHVTYCEGGKEPVFDGRADGT